MAGATWAQGPAASEPASAAKKELVAKIIRLQQPGIELMARQLAEAPVAQIAVPVRAAIARLPQDRREGVARQVQADVQKYAEESVPIVRERASALAPATLAPMIEQRFTEDELRQIIAILESPVNARFQALGFEMQRALSNKVVAETQSAIEPKFKALEQSIQSRLRAASAAAGPTGPATASGASAAAPGPRASGRGN
ncbi:MAG: hypothetical protein JNJ89_09375 [Rubrivivax sp.]|nr:hypothetical protein [Rubrivivax sp.]